MNYYFQCDNNLDHTAVGNILLFFLLLLSFNFVFAIQAMLAGCPPTCVMMPERCCCCGDSANSAWTWSKISAIGFGAIERCAHLQHQQHWHFIYCVLWLGSFHSGFLLHNISSHISFLLFQLPKPRPYSLFNSFQNIHDIPSLHFICITFHTTTIVILLLHRFSFKCYHPQLLPQWDTLQFTWI